MIETTVGRRLSTLHRNTYKLASHLLCFYRPNFSSNTSSWSGISSHPFPLIIMPPKRKAIGAGAGRRTQRTKTTTTEVFVWRPADWTTKRAITENVSLLVSRTNAKRLVVKKLLKIDADDDNEAQPPEVRALAFAARLQSDSQVDPLYPQGSRRGPRHRLLPELPIGDLLEWKHQFFTKKNRKAVPESFIWRVLYRLVRPWLSSRGISVQIGIRVVV
jgi:hypothetical protein